MDKIFIQDLSVYAIVGIYDWERQVPQQLLLSIELACDISKAAETQDLEDSVNYAAVAERLEGFIVESQFLLLETLAEQSVAMIMKEFSTPWVKFRCQKTQVMKNAKAVGVEIVRGSQIVNSSENES